MGKTHETIKFYASAIAAPLIATGIGTVITGYLHHSNVTLIYLLSVLFVAARTSIKPALLCAVLSFLMYNFFFTEPRYSFVIFNREDMLTAALFLIMAALSGHQAARLRQQVLALQARTEFAGIQLAFLQRLAGDIDNQQVYTCLYSALSELPTVTGFIVESAKSDFKVAAGSLQPDPDDRKNIREVFSGKKFIFGKTVRYYGLHDGIDTIAVAGISLVRNQAVLGPVLSENIEALVSQASLVLGRIRLARDLDLERVEKERELLRSTILTSVSHDLRTPLTSMIGSASSLLELNKSLSDDQKIELLETILQEASRLDGYIQNLLDMTRLGYRGLRLERDWIGLDEILGVVMRRMKPILKEHTVNIIISPEIPLLFLHAALIEQAVYNVLENSVKYSAAGSSIKINASVRQQHVEIDISDSGAGIPDSERERIFELFYTINRKDQHIAGTGLGLAISRGMIGAHGGKIQILDNPHGHGTLVRISIPVNSENDTATPGKAL